jgi:hypothetical protein
MVKIWKGPPAMPVLMKEAQVELKKSRRGPPASLY